MNWIKHKFLLYNIINWKETISFIIIMWRQHNELEKNNLRTFVARSALMRSS